MGNFLVPLLESANAGSRPTSKASVKSQRSSTVGLEAL